MSPWVWYTICMFDFYRNKRVFVTGHTGFKGSWLCECLLHLGAEVSGYALAPATTPALFDQLGLAARLAHHVIGDIRDLDALAAALRAAQPDVVFHLAAQPLVRESYVSPRETFDTNVMGTVNVLEAVRGWRAPLRVVCITTDKVYENDETGRAFREGDPLGGSDPYSASKGACEIAIQSYRRSFFGSPASPVWVASARAGNVIGGGDWAADRLVPDFMRAWQTKTPFIVRNARATRPWQHVLESLSGYLTLGATPDFTTFSTAYNFGPSPAAVKTVGDVTTALCAHFPDAQVENRTDPNAPHEAKFLSLDSTKAQTKLGWHPHWDFDTTIRAVADWYRGATDTASARMLTQRQLLAWETGRW